MRLFVLALISIVGAVTAPAGGPASGTVKSATGTIAPKFATAYVVRDQRNPRTPTVEMILTDVAVNPAPLRDDLDRHMTAINLDELRDRDYVLLWIAPDGSVRTNATYSKTMTQYIDDSTSGLKAELTTNTLSKVEGRVYAPAPLKGMSGATYTIDVKFAADVIPAPSGTALPAGGGDPGKALTAFLAAIAKKDWAGIKAGLSPKALPNFDRSYNTPAENLSSAIDILNARLLVTKTKITAGMLLSPTVALLEVEGERFGTMWLGFVRMVKTGAVWQFDESAPIGMLR